MNPTLQLLHGHRSVRRYEDRPLPDGLLEKLVDAGRRASTSSNLQTYSVIHVGDPERKKQIAALCGDQVQIHKSAAFLAFCADLHRDRLAFDMHQGERFDGDFLEALLIATVDAALFMQNVAVAAESEGLGICMIGALRNNPRAVGELLALPPNVFGVAGLCIGYPAQDPQVKPRLPLDAVLHSETYLPDDRHLDLLEQYDREMVAFYESQDMHPGDPRWTTVVAQRVGSFHNREELDHYVREQGFGWKGQ